MIRFQRDLRNVYLNRAWHFLRMRTNHAGSNAKTHKMATKTQRTTATTWAACENFQYAAEDRMNPRNQPQISSTQKLAI